MVAKGHVGNRCMEKMHSKSCQYTADLLDFADFDLFHLSFIFLHGNKDKKVIHLKSK